MVVITGIITAIKIILRVAPVIYKGGKKIKPVSQYFDRHRKAGTIITTAAATAPLIYDLLNIDYDALLPKKISGPTKNGQARNNMEFSRFRRRNKYNYCPPRTRRTFRR